MSRMTPKRPLLSIIFSVLTLMLGAGLLVSSVQARPDAAAPSTPEAPEATANAFAHLVPVGGAPPSGGTIAAGTKFTLDLWINTGTNPVPNGATAAQTYMTFNPAVFQIVPASATNCASPPPSTTVDRDRDSQFETELQNEVCNGPQPCTLRGLRVEPGSLTFASGALSNCPDGCVGDFRVATITICAVAGGQGNLTYQFAPPAPLTRDSQIVVIRGELVQDPARYQNYTLTVTGPTATPGPPTWTPETAPTQSTQATPTRGGQATATRVGAQCSPNFSDVPSGNEFYTYIGNLYCRTPRVITGFSDNTFRPYDNTKRGQLAKMVVLAFAIPINTAGGPHFTDVPQSGSTGEIYQYVETAVNARIITGFAGGLFKPWDAVKRGQVAKMVITAAGISTNTNGGPHFTDVPANNEAYQYIETAFNRNLISGFDNRLFKPYDIAKRGQISKIVDNALGAR